MWGITQDHVVRLLSFTIQMLGVAALCLVSVAAVLLVVWCCLELIGRLARLLGYYRTLLRAIRHYQIAQQQAEREVEFKSDFVVVNRHDLRDLLFEVEHQDDEHADRPRIRRVYTEQLQALRKALD